MSTKIVDKKGRLNLGSQFANKTVIVEEIEPAVIRITVAAVIPEREVWLYQNPEAKRSVQKGLEQARDGKTAESPDLRQDALLAEQLAD